MLLKRKPKNKFMLFTSGLFVVVGLVVIVFLGVAMGKETYRKYQIQKEIDSLKQEAEEVENKNQELNQLIEYFQTDVYKKLALRKKLGFQEEGEKVVIIKPFPENYINEISNGESGNNGEFSNIKKWLEYFFREM